jgi:cyanophycinase
MNCLGEPARVLCLPTAAGNEGEERISYWSNLGVQHFTSLGVERVDALRVIDRGSALDPAMAERISGANFVYLSGGKPTYLYDTLQGTPVWDAILGVLSRGGVVAGCSAGAMIFGERIPTSLFSSAWQPAFNVLSGAVIIPHYDEIPKMMLAGMRLLAGSLPIVGIEGSTALICSPQGISVQGKGSVVMIVDGSEHSYLAGQTI